MAHPKSVGVASIFDQAECDVEKAYCWVGGAHFENPEEAYLRKEAAEERRKALTDKQWEVYVMRYEMGLSQEEIARKLGITPKSVQNRTEGAMKKIKKIF